MLWPPALGILALPNDSFDSIVPIVEEYTSSSIEKASLDNPPLKGKVSGDTGSL